MNAPPPPCRVPRCARKIGHGGFHTTSPDIAAHEDKAEARAFLERMKTRFEEKQKP